MLYCFLINGNCSNTVLQAAPFCSLPGVVDDARGVCCWAQSPGGTAGARPRLSLAKWTLGRIVLHLLNCTNSNLVTDRRGGGFGCFCCRLLLVLGWLCTTSPRVRRRGGVLHMQHVLERHEGGGNPSRVEAASRVWYVYKKKILKGVCWLVWECSTRRFDVQLKLSSRDACITKYKV